MGEEYTYVCKDCRRSKNLTVATYSCKGWGDRKSVEEITGGKYGSKAKKALEEHPHCLFHFQADVFQCACGYTASYDSLVIHNKRPIDPEIYFFSEHRCYKCRKPMRRLPDFPTDFQCSRCGGKMMMDPRSFFRWRSEHHQTFTRLSTARNMLSPSLTP